jgi:predicted metal-dependent hydrolase
MDIEILYGSRSITVHVDFSDRKRLSITVHPDCSVTALAPLESGSELIENRLKKRSGWIVKQLSYFEEYQPILPPRQYINGETHYYLGRQYRLRISEGDTPNLKLIGRYFEMQIPDIQNRDEVKKLMLSWQSKHAKQILKKRISLYLPRFLKMDIEEPPIRYRRMKKRWGSCSPKGVIIFNTELTKASVNCIDYVVVHELCHLVYSVHSQNFYRLLSRILPDWKKRKENLEKAKL